ncbi:hypothetical protein VNO77_27234 [Canavalia gladiata]|uniref:Uncharacterized protein n=1 Tax=Canavalia gladiata TaxID=3824 RepID=A0AAN9KWU9_CANGL
MEPRMLAIEIGAFGTKLRHQFELGSPFPCAFEYQNNTGSSSRKTPCNVYTPVIMHSWSMWDSSCWTLLRAGMGTSSESVIGPSHARLNQAYANCHAPMVVLGSEARCLNINWGHTMQWASRRASHHLNYASQNHLSNKGSIGPCYTSSGTRNKGAVGRCSTHSSWA